MDSGLAQLEWSREVIARRLPVSPLYYPPEPGLMAARTRSFDGLHGFLADSLPMVGVTLLMRKRLAKLNIDIAALTPLERPHRAAHAPLQCQRQVSLLQLVCYTVPKLPLTMYE